MIPSDEISAKKIVFEWLSQTVAVFVGTFFALCLFALLVRFYLGAASERATQSLQRLQKLEKESPAKGSFLEPNKGTKR